MHKYTIVIKNLILMSLSLIQQYNDLSKLVEDQLDKKLV